MSVSDRRQAVAVGLIDPAARRKSTKLAPRLVAAAGEGFGADAFVFEEPRQKRLGLGERLFASLSPPRARSRSRLGALIVPESGPNSAERLEAADNLLLSPEKAQKLRIVIGLDQPQLPLGQIEQIGEALLRPDRRRWSESRMLET